MRVLVVNAGSSSLKLRVLDERDQLVASSNLDALDGRTGTGALEGFLADAPAFRAIGHRVVHGARTFRSSVVVDDRVLEVVRGLSSLAPLHNPPAVAAIDVLRRSLPDIPQVACFDTAFHAAIPEEAAVYAVPWDWTQERGVRRYGFHGLNHSYAARRVAQLLDARLEGLRVVTCHLGAGASLAAVAGGRSVDTTMGFTPLEGLVMATRSGSVDPGAVLWLQREAGLSAAEVEDALVHRSGLLGVSGLSEDMREVLAAATKEGGRAGLALAVYVHRLRAGMAAMAAAMGGVDAVAFTGGVGENSPHIRREACARLAFLGLSLDAERNDSVSEEDADISSEAAEVRVLVVHAREDLEIAREVRGLLAG
jgi:acetate kinase